MASRVESIEAGIGTYDEVCSHWEAALEHDAIDPARISAFAESLRHLAADDMMRAATLAIVCSIMNSTVDKTGWLFRVNKEKNIDVDYLQSGAMRNVVASLLCP